MKWFFVVLMFSSVAFAKPKFDPNKPYTVVHSSTSNESVLTVKFGFNNEKNEKKFYEKDESPGFMSLKGIFVCPVAFSKATKEKQASFVIGCKANGVTSRSHVVCDGVTRSFLYDIESEKNVFFVEATCSQEKI